jgi:hypothetical protein
MDPSYRDVEFLFGSYCAYAQRVALEVADTRLAISCIAVASKIASRAQHAGCFSAGSWLGLLVPR